MQHDAIVLGGSYAGLSALKLRRVPDVYAGRCRPPAAQRHLWRSRRRDRGCLAPPVAGVRNGRLM